MEKHLFEGETVIDTRGANFVLRLNEHGLPRFRFDGAMGAVGMEGKEAIGGKIFLTNYRLFFQSHSINRFNGTVSIFLPNITGTKDTSRFLTKKLDIETPTYLFEFIVWGIPKFMAAIAEAQNSLTPTQATAVQTMAEATPEKCGDGLKVFPPLMELFSR